MSVASRRILEKWALNCSVATQGRDREGAKVGRPYHLVLFDAEALAPLRHDRAVEIRVYRPGAHLLNHHIRDDLCFGTERLASIRTGRCGVAYAVDPHAVGCHLERQAAGQLDHARLRDVV